MVVKIRQSPSVFTFLMSFGTWQAEHEEFAFSLNDEQKQRLDNFDGI
ncbi:hypothetical protein [Xenorhabdus bovienii]